MIRIGATSCPSRSLKSTDASERGVVIILAALLAVVIFGFVALAVDLYMFSSQKLTYKETVEQVSLAALRAFMQAKSLGKTDQVAVQDATKVAEQLAASNLTTDFTSSFIVDPHASLSDLGTGSGRNGQVLTGKWNFASALDGSCKSAGCFVAADANTPPDSINAVRATLRVNGGSRLQALFGRVIGAEQQGFEVSATAAVVPRRILFLIDLSRSIIRDNYRSTNLEFPPDSGAPVDRIPASEFAFDMSDATSAECANTNPLSYHTAGMASADAITYGNLFDSAEIVGPTLAANPQMHVKSDYRCFPIPGSTNAKFAVNTNPNQGPEPLTSILDGINGGLKTFASAGVPGNRVGMIAFDDEILPMRLFPLSPPAAGNADFERMQDATDVTLSINERVQYFLFPRYWGDRKYAAYNSATGTVEYQRMPAMTDLAKALNRAYKMLTENGDLAGTRNDVVLFSDGLHNCPGNAFVSLDSNFPCKDSDVFVERALAELSTIRALFLRDGIVLHTLLAGDKVGPHFLLRKNARGGGCLWPDVARYDRTFGRNMVNYKGGTMENPPYFRPNYLYIPVVDSGGIWSPLVDPCVEGTDLTHAMDQQCDDHQGAHGSIVNVQNYTDGAGRLTCNPRGRTKRQQVEELIRSLLNQTPYVLVE